MKRRNFISTAAMATTGLAAAHTSPNLSPAKDFVLKNNINHSVCQWCFDSYPLEEFLAILNDLGIKAIDLIGPDNFTLLKSMVFTVLCAMVRKLV